MVLNTSKIIVIIEFLNIFRSILIFCDSTKSKKNLFLKKFNFFILNIPYHQIELLLLVLFLFQNLYNRVTLII